MSSRLLRIIGLAAVLGATAACGGRAASAELAPKASRPSAPRLIRAAGPLRFTTNTRRFDFRIDVSIDEEGRPDVSGMRVMGNMGSGTREEIASWLARATFTPARLNGVPVRGTFQMALKSR